MKILLPTYYLLLLLLLTSTLFHHVSTTNLALTFDANNNTCTAACTTCTNKDITNTQQPITTPGDNTTHLLNKLINTNNNNTQLIQHLIQKLDNIVTTLSHIKNTTTTNAGAINDVLLLVEDLLELHNDSSLSLLPTSCQDIKNKHPNTPSGMYMIVTPDGKTHHVYCHMEELCSSGGGWTRIAYLDMSDSTEECPPGFRLYQSGGIRACGRQSSNSGSCQSVKFPSNGINYSQVCGKLVGYQYGTTDAMYAGVYQNEEPYGSKLAPEHFNINSYYVDGVSLTCGSPRQHIWTFIAAPLEASIASDGRYNCPCSQGSLQNSTMPSFIGNDYFCESGNPDPNDNVPVLFYADDPLWDGKGCGLIEQTCCQAPGLPWFHKVLNSTTTNYIEMRVCGDEGTNNEDCLVKYYEIYIK